MGPLPWGMRLFSALDREVQEARMLSIYWCVCSPSTGPGTRQVIGKC